MADNPEDDFLESSTADPSMTLGEAAYATGAIGSSFAPGAGVADVMGYAPDPFNPGQMLPSFSENLSQGNYLDAGIQTLGLAGDAFYAAAPFTMGVAALPGAGLKTLQAGAKTLRGARSAADLPKSPNTVLDEIYGQDTSIAVGPFALPHELDHKVKLELLPDINDPEGAINIAGIVSTGERGEGFGTRAMKLITGKADENNLGLTLEVDPVSRGGKPDLSKEDLVTFYEREGFIKVNKNYNPETKTTTYDPIDPETNKDRFGSEWIDEMYRPPVDGRMQSLPKEVDAPRPTAPKAFGGLTVREHVPNFSSISASLDNYEIVPNIQDISMKDIPYPQKENLFYSVDDFRRVEDLASQIKDSQEINPLIVVQDKEGFYVLEGAHRLAALNELGVSSFPAVVVRDLDELPPVNKAEGGVVSLLDIAQNMNRGPRGVGSLAPIARNMYRTMVS